MPTLDLKTIYVVFVSVLTLCAIMIYLSWRQNKERYKGIGFWVLFFVFISLSPLIGLTKGIFPDWIQVLFGNYCVIIGYVFLFAGLELFFHQKPFHLKNYSFIIVFFILIPCFFYIHNSLAIRNIIITCVIFIMALKSELFILFKIDKGYKKGTFNLGITFILFCFFSFIKLLLIGFIPPGNNLFLEYFNYTTALAIIHMMLYLSLAFNLFILISYRIALEKQSIESALQDSTEKLRTFFDSISDPIFVINSEMKFIDTNLVALDHYGYSKEEFLNIGPIELCSSDRIPDLKNALANTVTSSQSFEWTHRKKDGTLFPVLISSNPFNCKGGSCIIAVVKDITHSKSQENQIIEKNNQLESYIEQLKQTHQELIHKEKLAGIGLLAAGVAHEINNPLSFIFSNYETLVKHLDKYSFFNEECLKALQVLNNKIKDDELGQIIENILSESKSIKFEFIKNDINAIMSDNIEGLERIKKIVESLKSFSYININNTMERYDLNKGIKNTLVVCNHELRDTVDVIYEPSEELPNIEVNGGEINQVLLNLFINSAHAIKEKFGDKKGSLKIITSTINNCVKCVVEDNGMGISESVKSRIFEPFFTSKQIGKGSGLGLSIAYDIIVNKHFGRLYVDSEENAWTRITIELPIRFEKVSVETLCVEKVCLDKA